MEVTWMAWAGFLAFVIAMLALDLGVFHRNAHVVSFREAAGWSAVWVTLALIFNAGLYFFVGAQPGTEFLTGYLIEKSLSVDNIFVFVVIFAALKIPAIYQHRVLFWGILSALVMRAIMIFAGVAMLERFHWLIYLFGGFLVLTGLKLIFRKEDDDAGTERLMNLVKRFVPTTDRFDGQNFWTKENGRWLATPLLMALVLVEFTDVIFALDSIPAIFAVTRDPFIVFTSNIFAILGLRSLYFLLAGVVDRFKYLKYGLAAVLVFVGLKMALVDLYKVPPFVSLGIIASMLTISIVWSFVATRREGHPLPLPSKPEAPPPADY
jgi:tellurite resistance protein TerC